MEKGKVKDITVEILISIRDEIRSFREDIKRVEKDVGAIRKDIKTIVTRFDRDYMILAGELEGVKGRLDAHLQEAHR